MKLNLKHYKFEKTKTLLKTQGFLIISAGCFKTLENDARKYKLKCFLAKNNICRTIFKTSIFQNFKFLFVCSVVFVDLNFNKLNYFKQIKNAKLIGVKLYDKIYSARQVKMINNIHYIKNLKLVCMILKKSILNSYLKLIKI